jgi:hypothetical protein
MNRDSCHRKGDAFPAILILRGALWQATSVDPLELRKLELKFPSLIWEAQKLNPSQNE